MTTKPPMMTDTSTDGIAQNPDFTPLPFFPLEPSHRKPVTMRIDDGAGGFTIINESDFDAETMTVYRIRK